MSESDMSLAIAQSTAAADTASSIFHSTPELIALVAESLPAKDLLSARFMNNTWKHETSRQLPNDALTLQDFSFLDPAMDGRHPRDERGQRLDEQALTQYIRDICYSRMRFPH